MAVLNTGLATPATEKAVLTIPYSCRFDADGASPYMTWTPSGAGTSTTTQTVSMWIKLGHTSVGGASYPFMCRDGSDNTQGLRIRGENDCLQWHHYDQVGGYEFNLLTDMPLRDASAWYHIVAVLDTTQAVAANRAKLYVNGVEPSLQTATYPDEDHDGILFSAIVHTFGRYPTTGGGHFDGYYAEVHCVDGAALTPASFGKEGTYGEWLPVAYTGSHGTNGFYLDFADSGNLGDDESANTNDFTETNIVATDQMLDTPSNNFCTFNPLIKSDAGLSAGNLKAAMSSAWYGAFGWLVSSGKWYWEVLSLNSSDDLKIGVVSGDYLQNGTNPQNLTNALWYNSAGTKRDGSSESAYGASYTSGDIIGVKVDMDSSPHTLEFLKNNASQGVLSLSSYNVNSDNLFLSVASSSDSLIANFGQDSSFKAEKTGQNETDSNDIGDFYYEPTATFLALCTSNLPAVAVVPSEHFNTIIYDDGAGAKTGVGFQPDLVWLKSRGSAFEHELTDSVRGVTKALSTDSPTEVESTDTDGLTAFGSDGFTVGTDNNYDDQTGDGMVAWCWKINGGTHTTDTNGTVDSEITVNAAAGISMFTWTSTGATETIGHGLGSAPELLTMRSRGSGNWWTYLASQGTGKALALDDTMAVQSNANYFATVNSTLWSNGSYTYSGGTDVNYVGFAFKSIDGYSKIGVYKGNANVDGTFVYTGFRPRFLITKRITPVESWVILDSARDIIQPFGTRLKVNTNHAEGGGYDTDFNANGFKIRNTDGGMASDGYTYFFIAFADIPFKHSNAR